MQLLKARKGKEVYNDALATQIIAEDGGNPEVGESRGVFDLPVVKVSVNTCTAAQVSFLHTGIQKCLHKNHCLHLSRPDVCELHDTFTTSCHCVFIRVAQYGQNTILLLYCYQGCLD